MKLFEVQTTLTSYTYPVTKIVIFLLVVLLCIFRNLFYCFSNPWIDFVVTLLCFQLTIISILCLYISIGELFHVASNRRSGNSIIRCEKYMTIDTIANIVSQNDIIEIEVCTEKKLIMIGTSSECDYTDSVFKNKLYYISNLEYKTIDDFVDALLDLFPSGSIPVSKIDGLIIDYNP